MSISYRPDFNEGVIYIADLVEGLKDTDVKVELDEYGGWLFSQGQKLQFDTADDYIAAFNAWGGNNASHIVEVLVQAFGVGIYSEHDEEYESCYDVFAEDVFALGKDESDINHEEKAAYSSAASHT